MKILITGANGLLGQKLCQLILQKGEDQLIATARGEARIPFSGENFSYQSLDVTNRNEVLAIIAKHQPDAVIHTAAMTNVDQCESEKEACMQLNVEAVRYLAEACEKHSTFLLHLSTDFIFDGVAGPYDEEAVANPLSFYGQSKLDAENILLQSKCHWAMARTVLVYGIAHDMSRTNIILWVKKSLEDGKNIKVVDDQWRTPTLAEDLALGCYLITNKKAEGIFNISGKDFLTPYEMAIKTADFFKLDKSLITKADSTTFTQPAKRPPRTGFIIDKARKVLSYEPVSFEQGIKVIESQMKLASRDN